MVEFEPRLYEDLSPETRPSLLEAIIPIVAMLFFLSVGIIALDLTPQFPLIWGVTFTGLFAWYHLGFSWEELYEGISDSILMGLQAILILFLAYALISAWIQAGTIPAIMYYGVELLQPSIFLPITAIIMAAMALVVGSSWTTVGALGVAFIGIGSALGIPAPMTAGAILTGAYTGDKQSPLSDTTNLAAGVTNTDLYDHVNAMRAGSTLALGISVVLFTILGLSASGTIPAERIAAIQKAIEGTYTVTPLVFFPLALLIVLAIYGIPAIPTLGAGVFAGALTSVFVQGTKFSAVWPNILSGTSPQTGMELVNGLLQNSGLTGAVGVVTIILAALSLGGVLERTGILAVLAHHIGKLSNGVGSLTGVTALSAISMNFLAAEQYISIVVPGMSLQNIYTERGLKTKNLSRAIEAAGTTTAVLIPWTSGAVFMSGVLGVPTLEYAPYYFFGFLSPLILLIMGVTGWNIAYKEESEPSTAEPSSDDTVPSAAGED